MWVLNLLVRIWTKMVNAIREALVEWGLGEIEAVRLIDEVNIEDGEVLLLNCPEIDPKAQKELAMRMMEEYKSRGHDILIIPQDRSGFNLGHIDDMETARELLNDVHDLRKKLKVPGDSEKARRNSNDQDDREPQGTPTGRISTSEQDESTQDDSEGKVVDFPDKQGSELS